MKPSMHEFHAGLALLYFFVGLVVLSVLVTAESNFPVDSGVQSLAKDKPLASTSFFSVNLQSALSVEIEHGEVPVLLCLQRLVPPPSYEQLSTSTCTHLLRLDANVTNATLTTLTSEEHSWVLYYADSTSSFPTITVHVQLTGASCPEGDVYDGSTCAIPADTLEPQLNASVSRSLTPGAAWYVQVDLPSEIGRFTLTAVDASNATLSEVSLIARLFGTPSADATDAAGSGTFSIDSPRPGSWYIRAQISQTGNPVTATLRVTTLDDCHLQPKQGPGCAINVTDANAATLLPLILVENVTVYFRVNTSSNGGQLMVSVYSPSAPTQPALLLTRGQLPSAGSADVGGCNRAACAVPSISIPNSSLVNASEPIWFVSVMSTTNVTDVGVWFDSLCAPGCDTHGTCNSQGLGGLLGACECVSDYQGVDCSTPSGAMLGAQYIVLIIIASLVVASALIGFVAWAYMRRRRVQYDRVG